MIERPLILVPGILGSSLAIEKDPEFFGIWPLTPSWVPLDDFLDDLLLDLGNNIRKKSFSSDNWSITYDGIIRAIIKEWGYKIGNNFWTFPYDWRQSNDISGQMLAEFIKDKVQDNNNWDGVDIICHSMGGFVTRAAAYNHGADEHIKRTVYIASPHFGNPLSYFELHPDIHNVGFYDFYEKGPMTDQVRYIIPHFEEKINNLYRKWPSAYELMPDEFYLGERAMIYTDDEAIKGVDAVHRTYLDKEWKFKDKDMQSKVKDAMNFKKRLGNNLGNNDDILLIYCDTLMTLGTIGYSSAGITVDENTLLHFSPPFGYKQAGDTVVVTNSAIGSMSDTSYKKKCIPDVTHTDLPNDPQTLDAIKNFLISNSY